MFTQRENSAVLQSDSYKDTEYTKVVTSIVEDVPDYVKIKKTPIEVGQDAEVNVRMYNDSSYYDKITKITVDGNEMANPVLANFVDSFKITSPTKGEHKVVIESDGYKPANLKFTVTDKGTQSYVKLIKDN